MLRRPAPLAPHFVAFAWRYPALCPLLCSRRPRHQTAGLGFVIRSPTSGYVAGRQSGPPRFLRNPCVPTPCSPTPAGPTHQALRRSRHGPRPDKSEGSSRGKISGLNHTALVLAVYASSGTLLHATQDSLPAVGHSTGTGLVTRRIPMKGFELLLTSLPPFSSLPGAMSVLIMSVKRS